MSQLKNRIVLVGVGISYILILLPRGATCSGKTTVAKHLRTILPNSVIIHQDDFAPPEELIPIHPVHNVADWDSPQGAIDWPRFGTFLKNVKENGVIPPDHRSHDHLNEQKDIPLTDSVHQALRRRFQEVEVEQRKKGIRIMWGLIDGFLLYWDKEIIDQLDVRFFLRVPHDVLKQRRHERHGYHTAEGSLWKDPPMYWEQIVYPGYLEAHRDMFENGDVENGKLTGQRGAEMSIDDIVGRCCDVLGDYAHGLDAT
ncbi:P-loop containing nucleoside triphosphate hydrolase protein [Imleria badia]|nr:P-loop containing nucleoside triphosphate hydrolase protein [Imleria badia]